MCRRTISTYLPCHTRNSWDTNQTEKDWDLTLSACLSLRVIPFPFIEVNHRASLGSSHPKSRALLWTTLLIRSSTSSVSFSSTCFARSIQLLLDLTILAFWVCFIWWVWSFHLCGFDSLVSSKFATLCMLLLMLCFLMCQEKCDPCSLVFVTDLWAQLYLVGYRAFHCLHINSNVWPFIPSWFQFLIWINHFHCVIAYLLYTVVPD